MAGVTEACPKCGEPVGSHTVDGLKECLAPLYDHDLPFEGIPEAAQAEQTSEMVLCGSITVQAAVHNSPIGVHPLLVFHFSGPGGPLPPIGLLLDDTHMRSVRTLVGSAIDASVLAARKAR